MTKLENSNCDKTQKLKMWQNSKFPIVTTKKNTKKNKTEILLWNQTPRVRSGKIIPRFFLFCYQKYLFMCLKDFRLQLKTPKISNKCLEAKFQGCFCQVLHVTFKKKKCVHLPGILIYWHTFFFSQADFSEKKVCHKTWRKKSQFDRVILRPGWMSPYTLKCTILLWLLL